jgi:N-acetylglucosamine-6-sulfatase
VIRLKAILLALALVFTATAAAAAPNWLIIMLDDATKAHMMGKDADGQPLFPNVYTDISTAVVFDQARTLLSQCCPQRGAFFTGMYPHNTGILNNGGPFGGYDAYINNGLDLVSFFALLQPDYDTALIGKIMNNYPKQNLSLVPAGFNYWYGLSTVKAGQMFSWSAINTTGVEEFHSCATDACYQTNVLADKANAVIKRQKQHGKPFVLLVAPFAPHNPAQSSVLYSTAYASEPLAVASKPSFNEADVSDKPADVQATALLGKTKIATLTAENRNVLRSARSVDDLYLRLRNTLQAERQLENTCIAFISDNGFLRGEHRLTKKVRSYRESIEQVFFIWCPGAVPGQNHKLVGIHDLMPTILESAGKPIPAWVDGRSLWGEIMGTPANTPRTALYIRGNPPVDSEGGTYDTSGQAFDGLATEFWTYTLYDGGLECEFYDLIADPYELSNICGALPGDYVEELNARIAALKVCEGREQCGAIEELPLPIRLP